MTGTLADAVRTCRNNASASGVPISAILPRFQTLALWVSRLVVMTSRMRPPALSAAMAESSASST